MITGLLLGLGAALTFGIAAVVQARAVRHEGQALHDPHRPLALDIVRILLTRPLFYVAVGLNLAGFGLHVLALDRLPLFLAQAAISASLAVTALLAALVLHEHLGGGDWAAVGAVVAGLALLSAAAGDHATVTPGGAAVWWVVAAVVVLDVVAVLVDRRGRRPFLLGAIGGALFALVSVAARLLPTGAGVTAVLADPAAWALLAAGVSAFVVYSVGLQQGRVARVTAPLVVLQTVVPSVVGVVWLGDTVQDGRVLVAALGLLAVLAGSVVLGRFEATGHEPATA